MNMSYSYPTTMYESIFAQMYIFVVEKYVLQVLLKNVSKIKAKIVNNTINTYIWAKILSYIVVR